MSASDPTNPYNVRGFQINPGGNTSVRYYAILIDLPVGTDNSQFGPAQITGTSVSYSYNNGILPTIGDGASIVTWMLPVVTQQGIPELTQVTISDVSGLRSTGDPNKKRPPVVEYTLYNQANLSAGVPSTIILHSRTNTDNYFLIVMVNTGSQGGYTNQVTLTPSNTVLQCSLVSGSQGGSVAAMGMYPCTKDQFHYVQVAGGGQNVINWSADI